MKNYWKNLDSNLETLMENGSCKLQPLTSIFDKKDLDELSFTVNNIMKGKSFIELCSPHEKFIKKIQLNEVLAPKLFKLAQKEFNYQGEISNQYHIARRVSPGNKTELYRGHFDSHLFTLVLPIKIPEPVIDGNIGDLVYFPNIRKHPNNELENFMGKLWFHQFSSKKGLDKLSENRKNFIESFEESRPLLFLGNTNYHTNKEVSEKASSFRLTFLAHYFDPSPPWGVGALLRKIRNR